MKQNDHTSQHTACEKRLYRYSMANSQIQGIMRGFLKDKMYDEAEHLAAIYKSYDNRITEHMERMKALRKEMQPDRPQEGADND